MKRIRKILGLILSVALVLGVLAGCSSANKAPSAASAAKTAAEAGNNEVVRIRVGIGASAESALGQGVEYFGKLLNEKSDGKIQVELAAGSVLGGDRETIEGVGMGTFEMCNIATGPIANFSDMFLALDLPYVVTDRSTAFAVLDGEMGRAVLDSLEPTGIYAMSFWELGYRDLYNRKRILLHIIPGNFCVGHAHGYSRWNLWRIFYSDGSGRCCLRVLNHCRRFDLQKPHAETDVEKHV